MWWRLPPLDAVHVEWSAVASVHDDIAQPSAKLVDLALRAAHLAAGMELTSQVGRPGRPGEHLLDVWPGEQYRFLAGLASVLEPQRIVEVGTFTGMSILALRAGSPSSDLVTYDIVEWDSLEDSWLVPADFEAGIRQFISDLSDPDEFAKHVDVLKGAGLVFIDGPKDGLFERTLLDALIPLLHGTGAVLVLDDIRLVPMLQIWRDIKLPKMDVTSLGHWSGTGLVEMG